MEFLSVVIITYNEEKNIGRCIQSVKSIADEILVLDSYSDDNTVTIAQSMGAVVRQSTFSGYVKQKNKAINLAAHDHILLLDADEMLSEELAGSIKLLKSRPGGKAYSMKRCSVFRGKYIRHGLWYPDKKLRLFDRRFGKCGGLDPHDRIVMQPGIEHELLKGELIHYTYASIAEYRKRNDEVSTVAARALYEAGIKRSRSRILFSPLWAFINGYLLRLGFVDGYNGLVIAVYTAQQSYSKYHKLRQLQREEIAAVAWEQTEAVN